MYKAIKLRSRADYLAMSQRIARGNTNSYYHHRNLIPHLDALPFVTTAVITCGMSRDDKQGNMKSAQLWLEENAIAPFHIENRDVGIAFTIMFADEGDAIRFAWTHQRVI